jgi:hypothetical protein
MSKLHNLHNDEVDESVYIEQGFTSRNDYLEGLAAEYGEAVWGIAELLGPCEDFDGLVSALESLEFE